MKIDLVKGFNDYSGEEAKKRAEIKRVLVETFGKYGFEAAETPIIEYGIKIFAQLKELSFLLMMGITPKFSCHKNIN